MTKFVIGIVQVELKRRAEVEKMARERAKVKAQKDEQERSSRAVAGVNHLEIPAELAFIFSKVDGELLQIYNDFFISSITMHAGKFHDSRNITLYKDKE
jgi:hypothetical protein